MYALTTNRYILQAILSFLCSVSAVLLFTNYVKKKLGCEVNLGKIDKLWLTEH